MATLIITRGLPGCGKSTWAQDWVAENPEQRARVNRDSIRAMLHNSVYIKQTPATPGTENTVTAARDAMIRDLLRRGISVVCDDTNLPSRTVRDLRKIAKVTGSEFGVRDMTDVPLHVALDRNLHRLDKDPVPAKVIEDMYQRYIRGQKYPLPIADDQVVGGDEPYVPLADRPGVWLVDIDGTVALKGTRDPFDMTQVHLDMPNIPVIEVVRALAIRNQGDNIIFMSGRSENCREATEEWLGKHVLSQFGALFMRPAGDTRMDAIVKKELFNRHIRQHFWVRGVLDDRQQVVDMWRDVLGLTVLQVARGDF